ncbi:cytochrome c biogenesis protein [Pontimicrobium aquaticum]|uniref:Cytochrome C biogenesis protein n=1 Tax=Pontimicrobium aquaticum TaxID=2565367 RepID=A0A4V5LQL3_9FLAO|nr:cytochrome c biogenesis protein CcsA [Pontimicrobium aquaticum]TJY35819.1 cytochrome C biogenesis protein [Pontimicrobium aquaticum]
MLKKLSNILFSTRLTAFLFIAFAVAMIIGTFMDAGQETSPTPYSRTLIYNAWWFETIMVLFTINFIGNIFRYRLLRKEKWATLVLHLAFIFIFIGAFITRYISFEGMMAIREGATENTFLSQKTYLTMYIDGDYVVNGQQMRLPGEYETDFSHRLNNSFIKKESYNGQPVTVELEEFIQSAEEDIIPDESGENYLKIVEAGMGGSHNHFLKEGQVQSIHNVLYTLNKPTDGAVNITYTDSTLTIQSPYEGEYLTMATQAQGKLVKDSIQPLALRSRYIIGNQTLVFPKPVIKGVFDVVKKSEILRNDEDGLVLKVTANDETKTVKLLGGKGTNSAFKQVTIGGLDFAFKYGSKVIELPFSIKLNDFIAKRFPGTDNSYSAYESKITVLDEQEGDFDFHIYMNNILNHRGYRFFQASFDPDEKGTILSVNHDFWGTNITYLGYILLYLGLMAILFAKHTRFDDLRRNLQKIKAKKAATIIALFLATTLGASAQETHTEDDGHEHTQQALTKVQVDSILGANIAPKEQADKLGRLVIQDFDGRMKPINTYASELLRKLTKHDTYEGFDANQVFLSMQESPFLWYNVPIIYLKLKKADTIRSIIGLEKGEKYATFAHFFTERGEYKLDPYMYEASTAQVPTAIQKEFIEANQRVNLLYSTLNGNTLKIYPLPEDDNNRWISPYEYQNEKIQLKDSLYGNFINTGFKAYLFMLNEGKRTGDFAESDKLLAAIKKTQKNYGAEVMISDKKINAEITYNEWDIFKNLFSWYMYAGTLMFVLLIVQIFKDKSRGVNVAVTVFKFIIIGLFLLHTAGLIVRWYISGHAPWSDAYESMIYVAWATMLFGLLFGRKSDITLASTAFVTAMILMIAHWNWMDPSIGTLQPVLNSYWLMIHVAVIVGSYGPFTLGMILGVVSLLLMIFTNKENKAKMSLNIKELTIVNEMALTVGLVMLTIGNFLGGMWANESWGRYWGWDPKETWALISIMVYAFVIHMRLVPGLRGRFGFNLASIIAFSSIIFTYFGVNFYLAGLHSYQSGQQLDSLSTIAVVIGIVALLAIFAYQKYAKYYRK